MTRKVYLDEISHANSPEDLVNGRVARQCTVEDVEVTLETLWDIVTTSTWMNHGRHHLNVHDVGELSGFF